MHFDIALASRTLPQQRLCYCSFTNSTSILLVEPPGKRITRRWQPWQAYLQRTSGWPSGITALCDLATTWQLTDPTTALSCPSGEQYLPQGEAKPCSSPFSRTFRVTGKASQTQLNFESSKSEGHKKAPTPAVGTISAKLMYQQLLTLALKV